MKLVTLARKLSSLQGRDRWTLLPATMWLVAMRAALRLLPFRTVFRWADVPADGHTADGPLDPSLQRRLRALERAGHGLFPRNPCLTQALVAHRMLRKRGFSSELRIGVRRTPDVPLEAHAWVEVHGKVVIGERGLTDGHTPLSFLPTSTHPRRPEG